MSDTVVGNCLPPLIPRRITRTISTMLFMKEELKRPILFETRQDFLALLPEQQNSATVSKNCTANSRGTYIRYAYIACGPSYIPLGGLSWRKSSRHLCTAGTTTMSMVGYAELGLIYQRLPLASSWSSNSWSRFWPMGSFSRQMPMYEAYGTLSTLSSLLAYWWTSLLVSSSSEVSVGWLGLWRPFELCV